MDIDFTIDLTTLPLTDFSETVGESNSVSLLWGSPLKRLPFGHNQTYDPYDECWRRLEYQLWFDRISKVTGSQQSNGDWEMCMAAQSTCDGKCGALDKKCICLPLGHGREDRQGVKKWVKDCGLFSIIRYNKEHDYCPPLKDCSPNWHYRPIPPGCPPAAYELTDCFILPPGPPTTDYPLGSPPDSDKVTLAIKERIIDGMENLMDELLARLAAQGKNMMCEGGPEDIEPPQG